MDLRYTERQRRFRAEARAWLEANAPPKPFPGFDTEQGFARHREWERRLHAGGWGALTWPKRYGGRGCDLVEWLVFEEEYYRAAAPPRLAQNGLFLLAPTLMEHGTPAQCERFLPPMAAGDEIWAQGWSEPDAGSDMAAIRARAERRGEAYALFGQKIWSTRAVWADWLFGLFRSDPESRRHRGLSFLLVPLRAAGVTVRPIPQLDGLPGFAEVFFDGVEVPVENRVGAEGDGWRVAMATAGFERGLMLRSPARFQRTAQDLLALYRARAARGAVDPALADAALRAWQDAEAYALATYATVSRLAKGGRIGAEASMNKVFWSELDQRMHAVAMELLGADAECAAAQGGVDWLAGFLFAQAGPIYAGTNEIQRNIVAERGLGMPRA